MPDFGAEELLAIEADRRRRITAAFRLGSQATVESPSPSWLFPLAIGIVIAIAIALLLGIGTLVQNASRTPAPVATPSAR
jgi:hypothetical protein